MISQSSCEKRSARSRRRERSSPHQGGDRQGAGYLNKRLLAEDTIDFDHKPQRAKKSYRIVVLRKWIVEERGQRTIAEDFRYFFYITNDRSLSQDQVIAESNGRCNQENLIEQLKNGVRALHTPVNTLNANWAYLVIAAIAWSLKVWFGLLIPVSPRWRQEHEAERDVVVRMDFRTFPRASSSSQLRSCAADATSFTACSPGGPPTIRVSAPTAGRDALVSPTSRGGRQGASRAARRPRQSLVLGLVGRVHRSDGNFDAPLG